MALTSSCRQCKLENIKQNKTKNSAKQTSGNVSARHFLVTFIRLGWLNPGVSARKPPPGIGSNETWRVVCFPLPLFLDTVPTRCSPNHLLFWRIVCTRKKKSVSTTRQILDLYYHWVVKLCNNEVRSRRHETQVI